MNKYLLTSDLHIHPHHGNNLFIDVGVDYLQYIYEYCLKNDIINLFLLGDIFHTSSKINIEVFIPVFEQMEKMSRDLKITIIPGNHELLAKNKKTILNALSPFATIYNEYEFIDTDNGSRFHFLPFARRIEEDAMSIGDCDNILFTHIDIAGFKMTFTKDSKGMKQDFFKDFHTVFSGHFHLHQNMRNIVYIGSPYQQNFGEVGQRKGFAVYDDSSKTWEEIEYKNAPKFKVLTPEQSLTEDLSNTFIKLKIDKKIDNLSKLREILYDKGAIDVIQDFDTQSDSSQIDEVKIDGDKSLSNMIQDFIEQDTSTELDKSKLLSTLEKIIKE